MAFRKGKDDKKALPSSGTSAILGNIDIVIVKVRKQDAVLLCSSDHTFDQFILQAGDALNFPKPGDSWYAQLHCIVCSRFT
jgi:hypothetical protein